MEDTNRTLELVGNLRRGNDSASWDLDTDKNLASYYTEAWNTGGYSVTDKTVDYKTAGTAQAQVELTGIVSTDNMTPSNDKVISLTKDNFASNNVEVQSNKGEYKFNISGDGLSGKTFTGQSGVDNITNSAQGLEVKGKGGKDNITNSGASAKIYGDDDDDTINNTADYVYIDGGDGNDNITNTGKHVTIVSSEGDDVITGFDETCYLQIGDGKGSYTTEVSGNDLIVRFGNNSIRIIGGASITNIQERIIGSYNQHWNNGQFVLNSKHTSATLLAGFDGAFNATDTVDYKNGRVNLNSVKTVKTNANISTGVVIIGNKKDNKIDGGKGDDTLSGGKGKDTLTGGKGYDIFVYSNGDGKDTISDYTSGEDTISIASGEIKSQKISGKNVILKVGRGELTVKNAVGKKITTVDADGEESTKIYRKEGTFSEDETEIEFFPTFEGTFKAKSYKKLETIDASAIKNQSIEIIGNDKGNSIVGGSKSDILDGGKGNDTLSSGKGDDTLRGGDGNDILTGGNGFDVFVYESGNDTITDYGNNGDRDKIQLLTGSITTDYSINGDDLTIEFDKGSLTINDGADKEIKFLDADGNETSYIFTEDILYNATKTCATLLSGKSFDAGDKIKTIDASNVLNSVDITGNWKNNVIFGSDSGGILDGGKGYDKIYGNTGNDTIIGGLGDDELWGNGGRDTFIYNSGDGDDIIHGFGKYDYLEINGFDDADILPKYDGETKEIYIKLGKGSVTLKDFGSTTSFDIGNYNWQLSGSTLTRK